LPDLRLKLAGCLHRDDPRIAFEHATLRTHEVSG
jgi:hypothetical protein